MTHPILISAVLLALSIVGCATPARSPTQGNLKVEVTPAETTYSIGRHGRGTNAFLVRFRVSNLNSDPCLIWVMTCSYWDHWKTDNEAVSVDTGSCDSNYPILRLLTLTNPYIGELRLVVQPIAKGHEITFHMAFSPMTNFTITPPVEALPPTVDTTVSTNPYTGALRLVSTPVIGGTYWSEKIKIKVSE